MLQVGDTLGRRFGIIAYLCLFTAGVAMQTASTSIPLFVVGRVVSRGIISLI
jgi:MFS family permease